MQITKQSGSIGRHQFWKSIVSHRQADRRRTPAALIASESCFWNIPPSWHLSKATTDFLAVGAIEQQPNIRVHRAERFSVSLSIFRHYTARFKNELQETRAGAQREKRLKCGRMPCSGERHWREREIGKAGGHLENRKLRGTVGWQKWPQDSNDNLPLNRR